MDVITGAIRRVDTQAVWIAIYNHLTCDEVSDPLFSAPSLDFMFHDFLERADSNPTSNRNLIAQCIVELHFTIEEYHYWRNMNSHQYQLQEAQEFYKYLNNLHLEAGNDKDKTFLRDQFALKRLLPLSVSYSKHRTKLQTILRPNSALQNFIMKGRDDRRTAPPGWNTCESHCTCATEPVKSTFGRRNSTGRTIMQIQENIRKKITQVLKPFAYDELLLPGFDSRAFDISSSFEILAVTTESFSCSTLLFVIMVH